MSEKVLDFNFEAAHRLPMVDPDHKCYQIHGHSYHLQITIKGDLEPAQIIAEHLVGTLRHRYLNELEGLENATSENISRWIWDQLKEKIDLIAVQIDENSDSACIYRGV